VWIVVEAASRLAAGPPEIPGLPVLIVASIGLAVNVGSAVALWRSGADD
jgi:cobalt-zinc-cadmium efflux system protein